MRLSSLLGGGAYFPVLLIFEGAYFRRNTVVPGAGMFSVRNAETEVFDRILLVTEKAVLSQKRTTQTNPKENNG